MPEGHTIHRLAGTHRRRFVGREVAVSSPQGRFDRGAELVDGRTLRATDAHGKHLFHVYADDLVVHVHLGLYGKFTQHLGDDVAEPRGQVRMRMVAAGAWADLRGAIACEVLTEGEVDTLRARLGADPLRRDTDPETAWRRISRSRAPLATLLMDQSVIAGVGNVYRAEVLFRHRLDPLLPGRELGRERWEAVWADLVVLLADGVRRGAIDTVADETCTRAAPTILTRGTAAAAGAPSTSTAGRAGPAGSVARRSRNAPTPPATCSGARRARQRPEPDPLGPGSSPGRPPSAVGPGC